MGFIEPCIPTQVAKPPSGLQWIHEIKLDGYRLIVCRRQGHARLFTRRGYDWSERYPLIAAAAASLTVDATIDGEAVVCDRDGIANLEALRNRKNDRSAILYAFDLLEVDGADLRPLPLSHRKERLRQLLQGCPLGIQFNDHIEGDGAIVFAHACKLGFEGIISKDRTRAYQSGLSKTWLKVKNPASLGLTLFHGPGASARFPAAASIGTPFAEHPKETGNTNGPEPSEVQTG